MINVIVKDNYNIRYDISKNVTVQNGKDIIEWTTVIYDPRVPGEAPKGFIKNKILYLKGIITVIKTIMEVTDDHYSILAEGADQIITESPDQYIQVDGYEVDQVAKYYLNNDVSDDVTLQVDIT